jgi:hypothetical protein
MVRVLYWNVLVARLVKKFATFMERGCPLQSSQKNIIWLYLEPTKSNAVQSHTTFKINFNITVRWKQRIFQVPSPFHWSYNCHLPISVSSWVHLVVFKWIIVIVLSEEYMLGSL